MAGKVYDKVKNYIEKYRMIEAGDLVVAGVSGGADSVCLLHLLHRLSAEIPCRLTAVHVDHGVRPESARDAAFTERLCGELGIPFSLKKADMNGYAAAHGLTPEEAGRQIRYAAFEEVLAKQRAGAEKGKIAVAHNADDRAETMLFHMFRGSGLKGLCSIQPVREHVIRPILCLEREEIERYLAEAGLEYCVDATNRGDAYTRNRIRHHILPYAEQEICSGAVAHMNDLADILSETEEYLEAQTSRLYEVYVEELPGEPPGLRVACGLLSEAPAMYRRVLLSCMERLTPHRKDITGRHIADLTALMAKQGGRELYLPYGIRACKEYNALILRQNASDGIPPDKGGAAGDRVYAVMPPAEISVPGEGTFAFALLQKSGDFWKDWQNIPQNRYTKWFDYDKITTALELRTRRQGDYLTIDTALHTKSVKQYMIDEKIPKARRDDMHILADGAHILWIPGYRISQHYKVEEKTTRILQVRLRGDYHGGTS